MRSIITEINDRCFICGSRRNLAVHHCWHGFANRKLADEDGLVVTLCQKCHTDLHDKGLEDRWLMGVAQKAWMKYYGKSVDEFRKRYGRSVI